MNCFVQYLVQAVVELGAKHKEDKKINFSTYYSPGVLYKLFPIYCTMNPHHPRHHHF